MLVTGVVGCSSQEKKSTSQDKTAREENAIQDTENGLSEAIEEDTGNTSDDIVDLTKLSSTMVYAEVYNMILDPDYYTGKTVKMAGQFIVSEDPVTEVVHTACLILDEAGCCSQAVEFALPENAQYPEDYPELNSNITVIGTFQTYEMDGMRYCCIENAKILS